MRFFFEMRPSERAIERVCSIDRSISSFFCFACPGNLFSGSGARARARRV